MSKPRVTRRDREVAHEAMMHPENRDATVAAYREEVTGELVKCLKEACENFDDMDHDEEGEGDGDPLAHWRAAIAKAEGRE